MVTATAFDALSFPMFTMATMYLLGLAGAWWRILRVAGTPEASR